MRRPQGLSSRPLIPPPAEYLAEVELTQEQLALEPIDLLEEMRSPRWPEPSGANSFGARGTILKPGAGLEGSAVQPSKIIVALYLKNVYTRLQRVSKNPLKQSNKPNASRSFLCAQWVGIKRLVQSHNICSCMLLLAKSLALPTKRTDWSRTLRQMFYEGLIKREGHSPMLSQALLSETTNGYPLRGSVD